MEEPWRFIFMWQYIGVGVDKVTGWANSIKFNGEQLERISHYHLRPAAHVVLHGAKRDFAMYFWGQCTFSNIPDILCVFLLVIFIMREEITGRSTSTTVYQNHHHFGGELPDQYQSLLFWTKKILAGESVTQKTLSDKFNNGQGLPTSMRVEVEEARKILLDGVKQGDFIETNGEFRLTVKSNRELLDLEKTAERDMKEAKDAFDGLLTLEFSGLIHKHKDQFWGLLGEFTTKLAIDYFTKMGEFSLPRLSTEIASCIVCKLGGSVISV